MATSRRARSSPRGQEGEKEESKEHDRREDSEDGGGEQDRRAPRPVLGERSDGADRPTRHGRANAHEPQDGDACGQGAARDDRRVGIRHVEVLLRGQTPPDVSPRRPRPQGGLRQLPAEQRPEDVLRQIDLEDERDVRRGQQDPQELSKNHRREHAKRHRSEKPARAALRSELRRRVDGRLGRSARRDAQKLGGRVERLGLRPIAHDVPVAHGDHPRCARRDVVLVSFSSQAKAAPLIIP